MQTRVTLSHDGKAKIDILKIHRLLIIKLYLQTVLLLRASDCANITSGMLPVGLGAGVGDGVRTGLGPGSPQ